MPTSRMIVPVGFDLESAVRDASKDAEAVLRRLQKTIDDKPLTITPHFATDAFVEFENAFNSTVDHIKTNAEALRSAIPVDDTRSSIRTVKDALKELEDAWAALPTKAKFDSDGKLTAQAQKLVSQFNQLRVGLDTYGQSLSRIAADIKRTSEMEARETKKARDAQAERARIMALSENTIANLTAKLKLYKKELQESAVGSSAFNSTAATVKRLTEELEHATGKVKELTTTAKEKAKEYAEQINHVNREWRAQTGYIDRLIKRIAVYASLAYIKGFLDKVREVTAQFELQRVALGAIIADQQRANQLFGEIKSFALKSPLKIMDLVTYTKQVAAYRIETDKLFDTTKRLADVSVGLGVDMSRLVLAYGQVKAASYLRAAEIRQFTEAGIPMLELLAERFTQLQGKVVSTEEVMDKVSKRLVPFAMVEQIFKDMTDAGGMFYNMQEKQSQTLYGMWSKLGDAASVMYDEIGNTGVVNAAMKKTIELLQKMMQHWSGLLNIIQTGVIGWGTYKVAISGVIPFYKLYNLQVLNRIKNEKRLAATTAEAMSIGRARNTQERELIAHRKTLTAEDYKLYLKEAQLNNVRKLSLARQAAHNSALHNALIQTKMFTAEQLRAIAAMSKSEFRMAKFNVRLQQFKDSLAKTGLALKALSPMLALTAGTELFMDWLSAVSNQNEALDKVRKHYDENWLAIEKIKNSYKDVQEATKAATMSEEEFAKTSFSQKLEQLQKVVKMLSQYGLNAQIDLSVINYENIDTVMGKWTQKLEQANELSKSWGSALATINEAWEGNIFGWSIAGENLKTDMKDLRNSWTKVVTDSKNSQNLEKMRTYVEALSHDNKDLYKYLSTEIQMDAKLALQQRARNESELQYQQRIMKYYDKISQVARDYNKEGGKFAKAGKLFDFGTYNKKNLESTMNEVYHEIDKIKETFRGKDALTVKMAIDEQAALNDWETWQKDLIIQHLNEHPITLNAELIPTTGSPQAGSVAEGLKASLMAEFPTLFTDDELQSLTTTASIIDAINQKLDANTSALEQNYAIQNNITGSAEATAAKVAQIEKWQKRITEIKSKEKRVQELQNRQAQLASDIEKARYNDAKNVTELEKEQYQVTKELSDLRQELANMDPNEAETLQKRIQALRDADKVLDDQLTKEREQLETEREMLNVAKTRVAPDLGDIATDFKKNFSDLIVDATKEITDPNYNKSHLISEDDLANIKTITEMYDWWAQETKAIADEKQKIVGAGISEASITAAQLKIDQERAKLRLQMQVLEDQRQEIEQKHLLLANLQTRQTYYDLKAKLAAATTEAERAKIQGEINRLLGEGYEAEVAKLNVQTAQLMVAMEQQNLAFQDQERIRQNLEDLDDWEKRLADVGKYYNFHLQDKDGKKGGSEEDPWIILMKNRSSFMKDFQKGVEDLNKTMEKNMALGQEQDIMLYRGASLQIDVHKLNGSRQELVDWYDDAIKQVKDKIAKLGGKTWEGLGVQAILAKDTKSRIIKKYQELLQELFNAQTDFRTDKLKKDMEAALKRLADQVSRTKTAKEFFNKILEQTGNLELAATISMSVYNTAGEDLFNTEVEQIKKAFESNDITVTIDVDQAIDYENQRIDYAKLAQIYDQYEKYILEGNRTLAAKIVSEGQKTAASQIETWEKELAKAKSYEEQRTDIVDRETQRRIAINKSTLPRAEKDRLIGLSYDKEAQDIADLNVKAFKESDDYIKIFENLDKVSGAALRRLKKRIREVIDANKDLSPENMKTLVKAANDIDKQLNERGFGRVMAQSVKDYIAASKKLKKAKDDLKAAKAAKEEQMPAVQEEIVTATKEQADAQKEVDDLIAQGSTDTWQLVAANTRLIVATSKVTKAKQKQQKLTDDVNEAEQEVTDQQDAQRKASSDFWEDLGKAADGANSLASELKSVSDLLGIAEDSAAGIIFDSAISGLEQFASGIETVISLQEMFNAIAESNPYILAAAALVALGTMLTSWIGNNKVAKANQEIERQQKILDQLEYQYERLQNAADKLFGSQYISNYNQQLKNLRKQQAAYQKQLDAERSKGKKADDDKIEEYEESLRDTVDEIQDMLSNLSEKFLGSSLADSARSFAQAWIDAYKEVGYAGADTFSALQDEYESMIENMVVESVLGAVMEQALKPMFDLIDNMSEGDFYSDTFWKQVANIAAQGAEDANEGAATVMAYLKEAGLTISDNDSDVTGISRNIAEASEEDINGLSQGINTQNYYIAHIDSNVLTIVSLLQGGASVETASSDGVSLTDILAMQNEHLSQLPSIAANTALTAERCERAANACEDMAAKLGRVIKPKAAQSSNQYTVNI